MRPTVLQADRALGRGGHHPLTAAPLREALSPKTRTYIRHIRNAQRRLGRMEESALKDILAILRRSRASILAAFDTATPFGQWRLQDVRRGVEEEIARIGRELQDRFGKAAADVAQLGFDRPLAAARSLGVELPSVPFGVPTQTLELSSLVLPEKIRDVTDALKRSVSNTITQAFAGGKTREQATAEIRSLLVKQTSRTGNLTYQAERIFRTEVVTLHNAAHEESTQRLQASNVKVRKQWLSALSRTTRPEHEALHGVVVDADAVFPMENVRREQRPRYPGDPRLPAGQRIQCKCTMIDVFEILDEGDAAAVADEVRA